MGKQRELYKNWKRARQQLDEAFQHPEHSVVIHYSCESFYDRENPRSPRVTSIAIRNLDNGQTKSFSIHLIAERRGLLDSIEKHYDQLEREMLEDFFQAVRERQHCRWLHWNMRDANYGFEALENRLRAVGGKPVSTVLETKRVDLSRLLVSLYGIGYIGHPRLENLMAKNNITATPCYLFPRPFRTYCPSGGILFPQREEIRGLFPHMFPRIGIAVNSHPCTNPLSNSLIFRRKRPLGG